MLYKIFVDDKDYNTEDGYTLYTYNAYHAGIMIETALNNGYLDIRISEAAADEKLKYDLKMTKQKREEIPDV